MICDNGLLMRFLAVRHAQLRRTGLEFPTLEFSHSSAIKWNAGTARRAILPRTKGFIKVRRTKNAVERSDDTEQ